MSTGASLSMNEINEPTMNMIEYQEQEEQFDEEPVAPTFTYQQEPFNRWSPELKKKETEAQNQEVNTNEEEKTQDSTECVRNVALYNSVSPVQCSCTICLTIPPDISPSEYHFNTITRVREMAEAVMEILIKTRNFVYDHQNALKPTLNKSNILLTDLIDNSSRIEQNLRNMSVIVNDDYLKLHIHLAWFDRIMSNLKSIKKKMKDRVIWIECSFDKKWNVTSKQLNYEEYIQPIHDLVSIQFKSYLQFVRWYSNKITNLEEYIQKD